MNDLISRQEAIAYSISGMTREIDGDKWIRVSEVRESIKTMPSAERERGRWQVDPSGYGFWICSACGFVSEASGANLLYKFCPNCGADMRGENNG